MEKRIMFRREKFETREENDKMIIRGYPIVFDELTDRVGYFKEQVARDALNDTDLSDVVLIVGHDFNNLLAKNGVNMRMQIDEKGLWFEAELQDTDYDKLIYNRVKSGILDGMSFGFDWWTSTVETDYENNIDTIRAIKNLYEITLTPIPAYPQTVATAVERHEKRKEEQENIELEKKIKELEEM